MSDTMLHGVLNMPPELWDDSELDKMQRHARYIEASQRIKTLEAAICIYAREELGNMCFESDQESIDYFLEYADDE